MAPPARLVLVAVAAAALLLGACGGDGGAAATGGDGVEGRITVFAAASLTDAFTEVAEAFHAAHPAAEVTFGFDASSTLARQIGEGAPADVFASADTVTMARLTEADLDGAEPVVFATNRLAILVAPGNPLGIAGLADLTDADLKVVVCAEEVPCGRYADEVLARAGVDVTPVSLERNVRGVVTKVTAGEADAGIVYATDVVAAGGAADGVDIPAEVNVVAEYPVAPTRDAGNPVVARAFIEFLTGSEGQAILAGYGFGPP